jgi:hypothetical protein
MIPILFWTFSSFLEFDFLIFYDSLLLILYMFFRFSIPGLGRGLGLHQIEFQVISLIFKVIARVILLLLSTTFSAARISGFQFPGRHKQNFI